MKHLLLPGIVALFVSFAAQAQKVDDPAPLRGGITGNITDGGAVFSYSSFGVDAANANFTGAGSGDQLFEYGWYFRAAGDTREFSFNNPDTGNYTGDTAILDWNDVGARGLFSAREIDVINEVVAGQATLTTTLQITNISGADLTLNVFHYADIDAAGTFSGDSGTLTNSPDFMSIVDGANSLEYRAGGNDFYSVGAFSGTELGLNNTDVTNFANSGLPFGPGDFTGAYQWQDLLVPAGGNVTLQVTLSGNTPAPVPAPPVTGGICNSGGPDAFGYTYCDSNGASGPIFSFEDISATGTPILLGDDAESPAVPIGFNFGFYGTNFTSLFVESNGFISFLGGVGGSFTNNCPLVGGGTSPPDALFPYWDDLDPGDDGAAAYTETFAICPYAGAVAASGPCTIVQWEEFDRFPGDGTPGGTAGTFQAILFESGDVVYQYDTGFLANGSSATVAISNDGAANSLAYGCNTVGLIGPELAVQFKPPGVMEANLSVAIGDTPDPVNAGDPLAFTVTVSNAGPGTASNVLATSTLPAGVTLASTTGCVEDPTGSPTCNLGDIASGANAVFTINVGVDAATLGVITTSVDVVADEMDPDTNDNTASEDTTVVASADLSITKTDSVDPVIAGTPLTYTITISNAGPSDATNVVVADMLPAGVSLVSTAGCAEDPAGVPACTLGTIAAGGNAVASVTVNVGAATIGLITNSASVTSAATDTNPGNNMTSEGTTVVASADLSISKTDSADPATAGGPLTYTITVVNGGPSNASGVSVTDNLPAGLTLLSTAGCTEDPNGVPLCSLGDIPAGGNAAYTVVADIDLLFSGVLSNTATVSATSTDPNGGNDSDTETTAVSAAMSDLVLTLSNTATLPIELGNSFDFVMDLVNNGPQDNVNVMVNGTLTPGLEFTSSACATAVANTINWNVGALANGAATSCAFTVTVVATRGQSLTATAIGSVTDPNPSNNTDIVGGLLVNTIELPSLGQWAQLLLLLSMLVVGGVHLQRRRQGSVGH